MDLIGNSSRSTDDRLCKKENALRPHVVIQIDCANKEKIVTGLDGSDNSDNGEDEDGSTRQTKDNRWDTYRIPLFVPCIATRLQK